MLADYFTKPLQGRMFRLFRNISMGHTSLKTLIELILIKERVEIEKMKENAEKLMRINPAEKYKKVIHQFKKMTK